MFVLLRELPVIPTKHGIMLLVLIRENELTETSQSLRNKSDDVNSDN
jgi:hypothetical protein